MGNHTHHHAGHQRSCAPTVCACGVVILLSVCVTCAEPIHVQEHSCSGGPCRVLAAKDSSGGSSFVKWLGSESPIDHILGLYAASGSTEDVGSWLLESTMASSEEKEDPHAGDGHEGHNHRRRLLDHDHAAHGDHSGDDHEDHAGHDHGEEPVASSSSTSADPHAGHDHGDDHSGHDQGDDHSGHDHDDGEASKTYLNSAILAATSVAGDTDAQTVERALAFITACQIDASCDLGDPEVESTRDSSAHFGLKVGLALSFIAMTVIASFIPSMLMSLPIYNGLLSCLNAFSGAVFLTVGLTHLLPHVAEYEASADLDTDYPVGLAIVALGFILVLFVEQILFSVHGHKMEQADDENRSQDVPLLERTKGVALRYQEPLVTQVAVGLHAVLECITMGLAISRKDVLLLYAAICAHKVFTAMSLSTRFLRLQCPLKLLTLLLLPFHLLPPLAVILAAAVGSDNALASLIMVSLATGTFLYVGAFEVVCEEFAEHDHSHDGNMKLDSGLSSKMGVPADGQMVANDPVVKVASEEREWRPSKHVKFLMFMVGCGILLGITAALPKHEH